MRTTLLLAAALFVPGALRAGEDETDEPRRKVLVELFTSQG